MRLTRKNEIYLGGYEPMCAFNEAFSKLGRLEDTEEELGIDLLILAKAMMNGIYDKEGKFHKQVYLCFIDGEWMIADMQTDCWYPVSGYGKTWALSKDELNK
jgi:hypothetical protein